ncbi:hypothetical protein ACOSP7_006901 [Xanthoceras sorbifolium]
MAPVTAKATKQEKPKTTTTSAPKKPRAYPTYYEMVNEAITAMKERTGSSQIAIAKFIEEKQKANLPNNFKKLLLVQLRKLVANGKLVKVKNSFKLPPKSSATNAAAKKPKSPSTNAVAQKPKSSSTTAVAKKTKAASAKDAAERPKWASASAAAKKSKSASTNAAAASKKRKASDANVAAKKPKTEGKKAVVATKAKKPKSIKSPAKKVAAKKGNK